MRKRLAALLGNPFFLGLGVVGAAGDVAFVVGLVQDNDSTIMSIDPGPPLYSFLLFTSTAFAIIFLWAWWATYPNRPHNRFKAVYSHIDIARAALQTAMFYRFEANRIEAQLEADRLYSELAKKLLPLRITLPSHDTSDHRERGDRWNLLVALAGYASTGDIKAARERTGDA